MLCKLPDPNEIKEKFVMYAKGTSDKCNITSLGQLLRSLGMAHKEDDVPKLIEELKPDDNGNFKLEAFENLEIF